MCFFVPQDATIALLQSRHVRRHHAGGYDARADFGDQAARLETDITTTLINKQPHF